MNRRTILGTLAAALALTPVSTVKAAPAALTPVQTNVLPYVGPSGKLEGLYIKTIIYRGS